MSNNDIASSLEGTFNNVEVKDYGNGNYCLTIDGMTELYFNENTLNSSNVDVNAYIPGAGGSGLDASAIRDASQNGTLGKGIYSIGYGCDDDGKSLDVIMQFTDALNKDVKDVNVYGFSAGGRTALLETNEILNKYSDLNVNVTLIDPFMGSVNSSDVTNLKNGNIPVYVVGPNESGVNYNREMDGPNIREYIKRLTSESGLEYTFLEEPDSKNGHQEINQEAIRRLLLNDDADIARYKCLIYNTETDTFEEGLISAAAGLGNDFNIFMSMDDIKTIKNNRSDCNVVLSNTALVMEKVNKISTSMNNNDGLFNPKRQDVSSTANIINGMISAENAFFSISNDLHHRVRDELKLITKIAQNYYDMEGDLASLASMLNDGSTINFTPEHVYTKLNELIGVEYDTNVTFFKNYQIYMPNDVTQIGSVSMADVENLLTPSGALMSNLQSELDSAIRVKNDIDTFSSEIGNNLKGDVWNAVKGNLNTFSDLQSTRIKSCNKLMQAYTEALNLIKDYMSPDDELDTRRIPEIETNISNLKQEKASLIAAMNETYTVYEDVCDEKGNVIYTTSHQEYKMSPGERQNCQNQINTIDENITKLNQELNKLNGFEAIVKQATEIVNNAIQDIYSDYGVQVSNIVSGRVNSYTPSYGGRLANYNLTDFGGTIDNLYDIPYINQKDFSGPMNRSGCGWVTLASILTGLSGVYIDPYDLYKRQKGSFSETDFIALQREHAGVISSAGNPTNSQMAIFNEYGITPEKLSLRNNDNAAMVIANEVMDGNPVLICTDSHYSTIVPGENGKFVYMSSAQANLNGEYNSVDEIFAKTGINPTNLNYGVSYNPSDKTGNTVNIPTTQYSPTNKTPIEEKPASSGSNGSYNGGYNGGYSSQTPPVQTTPVEPETPTEPEVPEEPITPEEPETPTEPTIPEKPNKPSEDLRPIDPIKPGNKPSDSNNNYDSLKPTNPSDNIDSIEPPVEAFPDGPNLVEDPMVREEPIVPDAPTLPDDTIKDLPNNKPDVKKDDNSAAKAIGVLAGVGAAVGAAAYGAHKYIKSKEDEEEKSYDEEDDY